MASRYASAAVLLIVVAVAAIFQATSATYLMPEGKFSPAKPVTVSSDYPLGVYTKNNDMPSLYSTTARS